jgi:hypothetical protein
MGGLPAVVSCTGELWDWDLGGMSVCAPACVYAYACVRACARACGSETFAMGSFHFRMVSSAVPSISNIGEREPSKMAARVGGGRAPRAQQQLAMGVFARRAKIGRGEDEAGVALFKGVSCGVAPLSATHTIRRWLHIANTHTHLRCSSRARAPPPVPSGSRCRPAPRSRSQPARPSSA